MDDKVPGLGLRSSRSNWLECWMRTWCEEVLVASV
jgi:hypothetical protein